MTVVLGSGLCAWAASVLHPSARVISPTGRRPHARIPSPWRPDPVIANSGLHGLSNFYHGATPVAVLNRPEYRDALTFLGMPSGVTNCNQSGYFVPRFVPRPRLRPTSILTDFTLRYEHRVFLCLSVVGNLQILAQNRYIDEAWISDDIVFKIGDVAHADAAAIVSQALITRHGAFFPSVRIPRGQVFFRPRFVRDVNINFIDVKRNLNSISPVDYFEKILRGVYLRYGLRAWTPKHWDVYVQFNFPRLYRLTREGIEEASDAKQLFDELTTRLLDEVPNLGFPSFTPNVCDVMSGIHLGYDRHLLKDLPANIDVLDTSLDNVPGEHSAIRAFCASYVHARVG